MLWTNGRLDVELELKVLPSSLDDPRDDVGIGVAFEESKNKDGVGAHVVLGEDFETHTRAQRLGVQVLVVDLQPVFDESDSVG